MSREQFLRLLAAAEHLAAHIHEAPVWIVPCLEGEVPMRWSGSSIYPAVQNVLLAARAVGLGATLTTLYLQFEKEAEAALGLPPGVHSYAFCRSATPRAGSGRCAVSRSPMSSMKIGGVSLTMICSVPLPELPSARPATAPVPLRVIHGHLSALRARWKSLSNLTPVFSSSTGVFDIRAVA